MTNFFGTLNNHLVSIPITQTLQFLIPFISGVTPFVLILWFIVHKIRKIIRWHSKQPMRIQKINTKKGFEQAFKSLHNGILDTITIGPVVNEQITGAFVVIDAKSLARNQRLIKKGSIKRDNSSRAQAMIPGYQWAAAHDAAKGRNIWHRTHCVPFRYGLSEGLQATGLLFPGTSHLNSGDRPVYNYKVPVSDEYFDSSNNRADEILAKLNTPNRIIGRSIKGHLSGDLIKVFSDPNDDTHYSLDDFERLADHFIRKNRQCKYRYGVECFYDIGGKVPSYVITRLINLTTHSLCFEARLPNVH